LQCTLGFRDGSKTAAPFHLSVCVAHGRCSSVSGRREHDPTANSTFGLAQETIEVIAAGFRIPALDPGVARPRAIRRAGPLRHDPRGDANERGRHKGRPRSIYQTSRDPKVLGRGLAGSSVADHLEGLLLSFVERDLAGERQACFWRC